MRAQLLMLKKTLCLLTIGILTPFAIAAPNITGLNINTSFSDGQTVTINGSGFGIKPNAKPLLWWKADMGASPSPLGRKTSWDGNFNATASTARVAPNSSQAYRYDLGISSSESLSVVTFDSDELYMFRKTYEDFDITTDHKNGTFNFKTIRLWNWAGHNNIFMSAQGANGPNFAIANEYTDGTFWGTGHSQRPYVWKREEVVYRTSDIGVKNGIFNFYIDGNLPYSTTFINRDATRPNKFNSLYQQQVSNGAQVNSWIYYDALYVDDSWHRVILCSSSTWSNCSDNEIQIPSSWANNSISFVVNQGSLSGNLYLYVVDGNNVANSSGYSVAGGNPTPNSPPNPPVLSISPN